MKKSILGIVMILGLLSFGHAATVLDDAVSWMYDNGLTMFKNTTEYKPNNYIRRDEAAKMFVKFAKLQGKNTYVKTINECLFSDINDSHKDLKDMVVESCRLGIFQGSNGKFMPRNSITNEQTVAVLVRILVGTQIEIKGDRSESYYIKANTLGMLSQISMNKKKEIATRGNMGLLLATNSESFDSSSESNSSDFQKELNNCKEDFICKQEIQKKYTVSKTSACAMSDNLYQYPLESQRPNKTISSSQFYKFNNVLYYPIKVDNLEGTTSCLNGTEYYLYSYNCNNNKTLDLNIQIPLCGVKIEKAIEDNILLLNLPYEGGDTTSYSMFNIKNMMINMIDIKFFNGFNSYKEYIKGKLEYIFNTTDEKEISAGFPTKKANGIFSEYWNRIDSGFPNNGYNGGFEITKIDDKFIGDLNYWVPLGNNIYNIGNIKVDILNKKIIISK